MALPDISLLYNYKGAAYPVHLSDDLRYLCTSVNADSPKVATLVDLCCKAIVQDSGTTSHAISSIPTELCYSLMKAAVHNTREKAIEVLISKWPWTVLSLSRFAPHLFDSIRVLHSDSYLNERIRKGVNFTTCLAHTFVECLKKRAPTRLKCLDLSGYPTAEVIVNYMSSHVLLVYNEARQKEIISAYNAVTKDLPEDKRKQFEIDSTLPEESYVVTMDAFLQTTDTHMELCKALRTSNKPGCGFKLCLNKLDIMCLGLPRTSVLLEQVNPDYLTALCLQFNGLCNDALSLLVPAVKRLQQLTALDLSCNSINLGTAGAEEQATNHITDMLSSLPRLVRLDLSNNRTKTKLSRILSHTPRPLEYLKLCGCGLSREDLVYLTNSHHTHSLRELDISGNNLSRNFGLALQLLSALSPTLQVLELEETNMELENTEHLMYSINRFSRLQYLNIARNNQWTVDILDASLIRLLTIPTLKAMRLSYPIECFGQVLNPDFIEENIMDYTQRVMHLVASLCEDLNRPLLKLVFVP